MCSGGLHCTIDIMRIRYDFGYIGRELNRFETRFEWDDN